jgi:mRNA-degrading endonuclease HigB of HigAB toxin-antitoxin module
METRGAYRAFHAEVEAAHWQSPRDVLFAYPDAEQDGHRMVIPIDGQHCVVVAINYRSRIVVIEFAGLSAGRTGKSPPTVVRKKNS